MSDPTPAPKKSARREKGSAPAVPSVEALASVVRAAEAAKPKAGSPVEAPADLPSPGTRPEPVTAVASIPVRPRSQAPAAPASPALRLVREHGPLAAALVTAVGLGWVCGLATMMHATPPEVPPTPAALVMDLGVSAPSGIRGPGLDAQRLAEGMTALSGTVAALRADQGRAEAERVAALARLEAAEGAAAARLAQLAERLDAMRDGETQLSAVLERLDRLERGPAPAVQTASLAAPAAPAPTAPAAPPAPPSPAATGALPERPTAAAPDKASEKPPEKSQERVEVVSGWFLRGVHKGMALVEGRRGLIEVKAGETIPGVGRVEAIERRGREWVVVTARGLITTESW